MYYNKLSFLRVCDVNFEINLENNRMDLGAHNAEEL